MLSLVDHIGHRRRFPNGVRLKVPERRTGLCVDRHQRTAVLAEEHQAAGGGERAAPGIGRSGLRQLPRDVAGQDVDRAQNLLPRLAGWGPRGPTVIREDVKELVETVISDSWSFPDLRP